MSSAAYLGDADTFAGCSLAVDFLDPYVADGAAHAYILRDTLQMPLPAFLGFDSPRLGQGTAEGNYRTVQFDFRLQATGSVAIEEKRRDILTLLRRAERTLGVTGGYWTGTTIVCSIKRRDAAAAVLFDVVTGRLVQKARDIAGQNVEVWTLALVCLPYARGATQTYTSGTLTNGTGSVLWVPDVPGDTDALCQATITDVSTSTVVVNGARLARRGSRTMAASSEYTPVIIAAALSPGTTHSDAATLNATNCARLTTSGAWQDVCTAEGGTGALDHGLVDIIAHVRDSTVILGPPSGLSAEVVGAGTLDHPDIYTIIVTALDGSGNETVGSDPVSVYNGSGDAIELSWMDDGTASDHRVYWTSASYWPGYRYLATGSGSSSYTLSSLAGPTVADPPTSSAVALSPCEVRASVALDVASPQWTAPGDPTFCVIAGSDWEYLYVGTFPWPPIPLQEGGAYLQSLVRLEAKSASGGSATLDCDGFWVLPHLEPQLIAEYPGGDLGTKRTWVLDTRRDERVSGLLTDGTDPVGQVVPRGMFTLSPGGNLVIAMLEDAGGVANVVDAKCTLSLRVVPRFLDTTGSVT